MIIDDHRRGGGFALENGGSIGGDFLGAETRARRRGRVYLEHDRRAAGGIFNSIGDVHHRLFAADFDLADRIRHLGRPLRKQIAIRD